MKLILNKNHIYLPIGNNIVIKDATFNIQVKDNINLADYTSTVIINGKQKVFTDYFTINITELTEPYITLEIVLTNKNTGESIKYTADTYPVTRAVVLGMPSTEWYPDAVRSILERLAALESSSEKSFGLVYEAIRELKNRGEVL